MSTPLTPAAAAPTNAETKSLISSSYTTISAKYHQWASPRPTATRARYIDALAGVLPTAPEPKPRVLELGCGGGVPATKHMVEDLGFHVIASDISSGMIEIAKQNVHGENVEFVVSDMTALEFPPATFDAIMGFYSIFHLPRDEQPGFFRKALGWIKPGGYLLFNTNTTEGVTKRDDWMGAPMISFGLGEAENREMVKGLYDEGLIGGVEGEVTGESLETGWEGYVDVEKVGRFEERFHWFCLRKR